MGEWTKVPPDVVRDLDIAFEQSHLKAQEAEERQRASLTVIVGTCPYCRGGEVQYVSTFEVVGEGVLGGRNNYREMTKCACLGCGLLFDPDFPEYRKQIEELRKRE